MFAPVAALASGGVVGLVLGLIGGGGSVLARPARAKTPLGQYDAALLRREINLFPEWYLDRHIGVPRSDDQKNALERGYAFLSDEDGATITRVGQVQSGQAVRATLADGSLGLTVDP